MSQGQAEGVINRIIRQIISECAANGEEVSETLVAFIIKAVVLDPDSDFLPDKPLEKYDVQKLVQMCIEKLLDKDSPSLDTIKMQVFFELNYLERCEFSTKLFIFARSYENYFGCYYIIVSPNCVSYNVYPLRQVTLISRILVRHPAALQSIFPQSDVGTFLSSSTVQKRNQLIELTGIVTGIRLFNKDCCKGGAGIDDIPQLLVDGIPTALNTLHAEMIKAKELAATYTSLFQKIIGLDPRPDATSLANVTARVAEQSGITPPFIRAAVINARQYIAFLNQVENELIKMTTVVDRLCTNFTAKLKHLRNLIRDRPAIPSMEVYPIFLDISQIWKQLQDETVLLSVLTNTLSGIQSNFVGRRLIWKREKLLHLISDSEIQFDDDRKKHGPVPESERGRFTWLFPISADGPPPVRVEFQGFCAWSLIRHKGLLVPADKSIGYLLMPPDSRLYAFCSLEAVRDFIMAADSFLRAVPDVARSLPELIPFLQLTDVFSKGIPGSKDMAMIERHLNLTDASMQTEVHPVESYIDNNYEWNEWELRKKALKLANLRRKATSSVQTILSNWRRDNATQVYLLKDSWTTTKDDGYTQVPRPSVFYHGLRGCGGIQEAVGAKDATTGSGRWCAVYRETNSTTVDLTIPVEQQLLGSLVKGRISWY
ncbi:Cilia- and flagella-associated protein [Fasciolopsis buskii]|uniref:Cilia- and flagella-associated protein 206 n=1 Tax=Fasciolopsis buskii TaxID=27845 RepID=A0A8E0S2D8_9TREM|nr:Cilia- and flagella-associated protein [Fasciolopsis buski]